ncbi:MAG: hypothetical protein MHM6MM_004868 [Cercozoa sp. M6MM]
MSIATDKVRRSYSKRSTRTTRSASTQSTHSTRSAKSAQSAPKAVKSAKSAKSEAKRAKSAKSRPKSAKKATKKARKQAESEAGSVRRSSRSTRHRASLTEPDDTLEFEIDFEYEEAGATKTPAKKTRKASKHAKKPKATKATKQSKSRLEEKVPATAETVENEQSEAGAARASRNRLGSALNKKKQSAKQQQSKTKLRKSRRKSVSFAEAVETKEESDENDVANSVETETAASKSKRRASKRTKLSKLSKLSKLPKLSKQVESAAKSSESSEAQLEPAAKRRKTAVDEVLRKASLVDKGGFKLSEREQLLRHAIRHSAGAPAPTSKLRFSVANELVESREMLRRFRSARESNASQKQRRRERLRGEFREWFALMSLGHNVLLCGLGSKKLLAQEFADTWLRDRPLIVANGYAERCCGKSILRRMLRVARAHGAEQSKVSSVARQQPRSLVRQLERAMDSLVATARLHPKDANDAIRDHKREEEEEVRRLRSKLRGFYLLVNSADGPAFRDPQQQRVLALMAQCRYISVIASIDTASSFFLLDPTHWVRVDAGTFRTLNRFENAHLTESIASAKRSTDAQRGVGFVLKSLTRNTRDVLLELAMVQQEQDGAGLDFRAWFKQCDDMLIVSRDSDMKHHLTELLDHNLVVVQRERDGSERYVIPFSADVIKSSIVDAIEKLNDLEDAS